MRSQLIANPYLPPLSTAFHSAAISHGRRTASRRRGAAAVFGLVLTVSLVVVMAITIDLGTIHVAQTELRRSADAAAMAGCWELFDQQAAGPSEQTSVSEVRTATNLVASSNTIGSLSPSISNADVEVGIYGPDQSWQPSNAGNSNAVRVTLRRQSVMNGDIPLFFGALTGRHTQSLHQTATAAMMSTISGFYEPSQSDGNVEILPLALDLPSWLAAVAGQTTDEFSFGGGSVQSGSDGIFETNLYPKGTGAPGNRGTVDIGGRNNSTADLSRQIVHGISRQDFFDLGYPLEFNENGELDLNGDTGISAGIKDELASLIGKTRVIPIYARVNGNGNNAMFTIVRFEGVRILDVKLTGSKTLKRVIIQPAKVIARGARVSYDGGVASTHAVTPVMLVQ